MGNKQNKVVSCFQCTAVKSCFGCSRPDIDKETARSRATFCLSLRKGLPTETINVAGADRGLSRKNAEKLVINGKAVWIGCKIIQLVDSISDKRGPKSK